MKADNDQILMAKSSEWLRDKVFPLWVRVGVDQSTGVFVENLSSEGLPQASARRALVQARQIYAFAEGSRLGLLERDFCQTLVQKSTASFIKNYSLPDGSFVHSVGVDGQHLNKDVDLYTQAFALFGLAQGFAISGDAQFKNAALSLVRYLRKHRAHSAGGFTEIKSKEILFQSNPHMHLFESAIAWVEIDKDPIWSQLAEEIHELCNFKFIDQATGLLAEHFDQNWNPLREQGKFIFEPGHQYEWSWLISKFQNLNSLKNSVPKKLFENAERLGLSPDKSLALDEVWSDGTVKKMSSRFWPQSERVKSAVVLGQMQAADQAMLSLMNHFLDMERGLWKDTLLEDGGYAEVPVKASSLYHIINAISEYLKHRS